jgi:hypothetical protein
VLRLTDTQTASISISSQPINSIPHQKTPQPPSESLLYPLVNKEVEKEFSGRNVTL